MLRGSEGLQGMENELAERLLRASSWTEPFFDVISERIWFPGAFIRKQRGFILTLQLFNPVYRLERFISKSQGAVGAAWDAQTLPKFPPS